MLDETREPRSAAGWQGLGIHAQVRVTLPGGPLREVGVNALAPDDEWSKQADARVAIVAIDAGDDAVHALRLDRHAAVGAILRPELHVQQAQEVVDLGQRRDRAL